MCRSCICSAWAPSGRLSQWMRGASSTMRASDRSFCATPYGTCARVGAACDERRFRRARCGLRRVVRGIGRIDVDGSRTNERSSGAVPEAISSPRRARRRDRHVCMSLIPVHRASARQWNKAAAWAYGRRTLATAPNRWQGSRFDVLELFTRIIRIVRTPESRYNVLGSGESVRTLMNPWMTNSTAGKPAAWKLRY